MKTARSLFASLALVAISALQAAPASAATSTLTIKIAAQNGSGENGTATLTQAGADVKVVIALTGAPATAQPSHIHFGTCASLGGVAYLLSNVVSGASTTTVKGVTIDQLLAKPYAINVHMSADDLGKYVACGEVKAAASSM